MSRGRSTRPSSSTTSCAAPTPASASSSPSSAGRAPATISMTPTPAASSRRWSSATSSRAPRPMASTTTSSRRSTSPGRPSRAASARIGACSTPRARPSSPGPAPITDPDYIKRAGLAVLLGLLLCLPILTISGATATQTLMLAAAANFVGAWFAAIVAFWKGHYFVPGAAFALGLGIILLVPLVVIALARIDEIAAIAFGRPPRRFAGAPPLVPDVFAPKVSIHIPACNEPAAMLTATLDAVARLDYANFECVLVINNTPDPALWRPVEEHCRTLGDRFKFLRVESSPATRPARLRLALEHTAPDAEIIGVIDADYAVASRTGSRIWCRCLPTPRVGMVQSPQDHRDGDRSPMHRAMNARICRVLRYRHGAAQRSQRHHHARHDVPAAARGDRERRRLVERHHLSRTPISASPSSSAAGSRTTPTAATATACCRILSTPTSGSGTAGRSAACSSCASTGGASALGARASRASRSANTARLAQLAWRRKHRRRRGVAQYRLGAGRRLRQHRGARPDPDPADPRRLHGRGRAFHRALSAAGQGPGRADARRGVCRDGACNGRSRARSDRACSRNACPSCAPPRAARPARAISRPSGRRLSPHCSSSAPRPSSSPTTSRCTRSISSPWCSWCRACRSCRRSRSPLIEGTRLNSFAYLARGSKPRPPPLLPRSQVIAEPPKLPAENRVEAAQ